MFVSLPICGHRRSMNNLHDDIVVFGELPGNLHVVVAVLEAIDVGYIAIATLQKYSW